MSGRLVAVRRGFVALATALALCAIVLTLGAQDATVQGQSQAGAVRILPLPAHVDTGGVVTVEVWLENGANYYGLDLRLFFDTSRLQAVSGRVTPLWEVFDADDHFVIKNQVNNATGEIWYAVTNTNPAEPFTGTGRICSIAFTGVEPGAAVLDLYYVKGSTRDGDALFPIQMDGAIIVGSVHRVYMPAVMAGP